MPSTIIILRYHEKQNVVRIFLNVTQHFSRRKLQMNYPTPKIKTEDVLVEVWDVVFSVFLIICIIADWRSTTCTPRNVWPHHPIRQNNVGHFMQYNGRLEQSWDSSTTMKRDYLKWQVPYLWNHPGTFQNASFPFTRSAICSLCTLRLGHTNCHYF